MTAIEKVQNAVFLRTFNRVRSCIRGIARKARKESEIEHFNFHPDACSKKPVPFGLLCAACVVLVIVVAELWSSVECHERRGFRALTAVYEVKFGRQIGLEPVLVVQRVC
jgi:hypothetical protein